MQKEAKVCPQNTPNSNTTTTMGKGQAQEPSYLKNHVVIHNYFGPDRPQSFDTRSLFDRTKFSRATPDEDYDGVPQNRLSYHQKIQALLQSYWKRWLQEYLHNL